MDSIINSIKHATLITFFVFSMMILLDYLTVYFNNKFLPKFERKSIEYLASSFFGVIPGCLGSFFNVSLYLRGLLSFGALTGAMVATSGDEAFVMLAMFPKQALLLFAILFILGIFTGWLTDNIPWFKQVNHNNCTHAVVHESDKCQCFNLRLLYQEWKNLSFIRFFLTLISAGLIILLLFNLIGPTIWNWKKYTILLLSIFSTFIVTTVPEHYLNKHIWEHIFKKHIWKIFLWTFSAIIITHLALDFLDLKSIITNNLAWVFLISIIIGFIPESGPHLIFVTLFAQGIIPFSVLLASSIVQDGHGLLPLLSHSIRDTFKIKFLNAFYALVIAGIVLLLGF